MRTASANRGFALITALLLITVLAVLLISYFTTTAIELSSTKSTADQTTGFYAAEGGLNVRGEQIRLRFDNYGIPSGAAPDAAAPCVSGNPGSGDFACNTFELQGREVTTYVLPGAENASLTIPIGEPFAGLNALENTFSVYSHATQIGKADEPEALLHMIFRNRLVPLFQFAVFYDKDLEILPGANMKLSGRVHVNGDLYLNSPNNLDITGQVTAAVRVNDSGGNIYRVRKNTTAGACQGEASVRVHDGSGLRALGCANPLRTALKQDLLDAWNGQILIRQDRLVVPTVESFQVGGQYWFAADMRIALDLTGANPAIRVYRNTPSPIPVEDAVASAELTNRCQASDAAIAAYSAAPSRVDGMANHGNTGLQAVEWSNSFRNNRELKGITMLEVDMAALLSCLSASTSNRELFLPNSGLEGIATGQKGGLVLYFTVIGADSNAINGYGVRLRNGSSLTGVKGLTVVTDQALYIQGDYNLGDIGDANWKPASFIADSFNVLSNSFSEKTSPSHDNTTGGAVGTRVAMSTTVNGAVLSGTDTTLCVGALAGASCEEKLGPGAGDAVYNGGLENYPRLHEGWGSRTLRYRGSFVSLGRPQHVNGTWYRNPNYYGAAIRDWDYDTRFNDVNQLPPMTPRASYLVQERFSRDFRDQ